MSRPLPAAFRPLPLQPLSAGQPVREGSDAGGELDLVENLHFAHATTRSPLVQTVFTQLPLIGESGPTVKAVWVLPVLSSPWTGWHAYILARNTSTTDDGAVKVVRHYDGDYDDFVEIPIPANTAAWTAFNGILPLDPTAPDVDQVGLLALNGATGEVRVHSVMIMPAALDSIEAARLERGGAVWCPTDSTEADGSSPLSVALRSRLLKGAEYVRQTARDGEGIVGWSDNFAAATATYLNSTSTYLEVMHVPFRTGPDHRKVRWGLSGFVRLTGGTVRLRTQTMIDAGTAGVEVTLASSWAAPYYAACRDYTDFAALDTRPNADDVLYVEIQRSSIMSLTAWLAAA